MTRQESDVVVVVRDGAACFLKYPKGIQVEIRDYNAEEPDVVVVVMDGAACFLKYPKGIQVEIRDYDVEDYDEKDLHGDEQGNKYFLVVYDKIPLDKS